MPRTAPEKQTVTIKETWTAEELQGFGGLTVDVDWEGVPSGVTAFGSGAVWDRPTPSPKPPANRHLLCWLLGHAPYSDGMGSMHCARCLRRMP